MHHHVGRVVYVLLCSFSGVDDPYRSRTNKIITGPYQETGSVGSIMFFQMSLITKAYPPPPLGLGTLAIVPTFNRLPYLPSGVATEGHASLNWSSVTDTG